jgi:hypothetical protein
VDVRFFYQDGKQRHQHEAVVRGFAAAVAKVISLPPLLEVCLYDLGHNVYGGIDMYRINRVGINLNVPLEQLPKILTHELIHVHQKHTGVLKILRDGASYWHGILITKTMPEDMPYEEYESLPWELDVTNRLDKVFSEALKLVDK